MMKPQNVRKCAMPGTVHLQQLALPEHLGDLRLGVPGRDAPERLDPLRRGLAGAARAGRATTAAGRRQRPRPRSGPAR